MDQGPTTRPATFDGDDWWRRGVIYQIYPRSFADSDGDGVGDLRGHHRPPRPPRSGWSRGRCDLAVADLPVTRRRRRLRRQRPHADRPAVRHARPTSSGSSTRRTARHPGHPRPRDEPHERPASVVRRVSCVRHGPHADRLSVARPIARRRIGTAAPAEQLGVMVRRSGLDVRPTGANSSTTTRSSPSSRRSTGGPRRSRPLSSRWSGAGWNVAWTGSASTRSTSSSSIRNCRRTRPVAGRRPGPARSTATTSTSRTSRRSSPGSGPSSMRTRAG